MSIEIRKSTVDVCIVLSDCVYDHLHVVSSSLNRRKNFFPLMSNRLLSLERQVEGAEEDTHIGMGVRHIDGNIISKRERSCENY